MKDNKYVIYYVLTNADRNKWLESKVAETTGSEHQLDM